jgi:hypothetical protein
VIVFPLTVDSTAWTADSTEFTADATWWRAIGRVVGQLFAPAAIAGALEQPARPSGVVAAGVSRPIGVFLEL